MRELAVRAGAVSAVARSLSALGADLDGPPASPVVGGALQAAVVEFAQAWAADALGLAELARRAADAATEADQAYQQLERLLIPTVLR